MCESIKVTDGDGFGGRPVFGGLDAMLRESRRMGQPVMFRWTWGASEWIMPKHHDWLNAEDPGWIDHDTLQAIADAMPDLSETI